ncbi:MAG TPA: bifunctional precorrin-2 dehydrogenase/sirohydrochlorin ferrochelatase [Thermoanaerobaculia bacterium]
MNGHYYPVFLDLRGRRVTVVGGGAEAERRVLDLLAAGARVRVVAPVVTPALGMLARSGLEHRARRFRGGDLAGSFLAIAERDAPRVEAVWREAERRHIPLNVVDDPPRCSFLAPAVVRRGDLAVAVSTGGRAPALAVRLRQELERRLGPEHGRFLELAGRLRQPLAAHVPDFARRREIWSRLVDSDVLDLLAAGNDDAALARTGQIVGFAVEAAR